MIQCRNGQINSFLFEAVKGEWGLDRAASPRQRHELEGGPGPGSEAAAAVGRPGPPPAREPRPRRAAGRRVAAVARGAPETGVGPGARRGPAPAGGG
jgi:hypothetical protein